MIELKGFFDKKDGEIIGVASTQSADRDGEVIIQSGWELDNFRKNPVILAGHDYWSFPIGKATDILIEGSRLLFKMVFSTTEKGQEAMQLVQEGVLNTFSVGFMPKEWADGDTISRAELLEISLVSVPANPEAVVLAKGMEKNKIAKKFSDMWMKDKDIKEAVEEIEKPPVTTETAEGEAKADPAPVPPIENEPIEKEVKDGDSLTCECGKVYTLKFTTQEAAPVASNEGEEGNGRAAEEASKQVSDLVLGALKLLQTARKLENRKEDRK